MLGNGSDVWLKFYASEEDRQEWAIEWHDPIPEHEEPPFPRKLPRAPHA